MSKELPRLINMKQLAAYLGVSHPTIYDWMKRGLLPRRLHGTTYWDRKAVDVFLDRASGILNTEPSKAEESPAENPQKWLSLLNGNDQGQERSRGPQ